uniref:Uncharacterized protein n=1 Tax=Geospiza parvula TaxID=87175 RepID=A0A8U8B8T0_GEOPR
ERCTLVDFIFIKSVFYFPFPDACDLVQDSGECQNYILKWYYNKEQKMCGQFWYGGCGGNKNRFETQEECGFLCIESS